MSVFSLIYLRVILTTGIALLLSILPLPDYVMPWQVAWPQLVLIYWCMTLPRYCGIKYAWITGLLMDLLHGDIFGQNALPYVILAYMTLMSYQFLRSLPVVQQMLLVGILLIPTTALMIGMTILIHGGEMHWSQWGHIISSMLFWPWVFAILRHVTRRMGLNQRQRMAS